MKTKVLLHTIQRRQAGNTLTVNAQQRQRFLRSAVRHRTCLPMNSRDRSGRLVRMAPRNIPMCDNELIFRLPVVVFRTAHGKSGLTLEMSRIRDYLDIKEDCFVRLQKTFPNYPSSKKGSSRRKRLDYPRLAAEYQSLITEGICNNRAEVSRMMHVSRAWVTKVMGRLRE